MKTVTNGFKEEITKLGREIDFKFFLHTNDKIITQDGKFLITHNNAHLVVEQLNEEEIDETINAEDIYNVSIVNRGEILSTMMKELDFEIKQDLRLGDVIECEFGLKVEEDYEYINYGKYIVYEKEFNEDTKTFNYVAYDSMLLTMIEVDDISLIENVTVKQAIENICQKCGLEIDITETDTEKYPNLLKTINEEAFTNIQMTYRDVLDMICQCLGLSMISSNRNLYLKKLNKPSNDGTKTISGGNDLLIENALQSNVLSYSIDGVCEQNTYTGKNKLNLSNVTLSSITGLTTNLEDNVLSLNGTPTVAGYLANDVSLNVTLPAGTYTYSVRQLSGSFTRVSSSDFAIYIRNLGNSTNIVHSTLSRITNAGGNYTASFTLTSATNIGIRIYNNGSTNFDNLKLALQIEEGDETEFEKYVGGIPSPNPDYPQEIKTINGDVDDTIKIKITNEDETQEKEILIDLKKENLFDMSETPFIANVAYNDSGQQRSWSGYSGTTEFTSVNSSTIYSINKNLNPYTIYIVEYDENQTFIQRTNLTNYKKTFTTQATTKYIKISISSETLPTTFEIYQSNNNTPYYELCKIGNYKDILTINSQGNCVINKNIGKINSYNGETITTSYISTTGELSIGATVYYGLETPETITLENTQISLYEGTNHIYLMEDLETNTSIKYNLKTNELFDEKYLKDINVSFGEKYGPVNSVVLSRSEDFDTIYRRDEESISENGLCEYKIKDNLIMLYDDREDYIDEIFEQLNGLEYYPSDFTSTGITYLDWLDFYNIKIDDKIYNCLMLDDEIEIDQGLEERVYSEEPIETVTNYKTSSKTDKEVSFIVDKQNGSIRAKVSKGEVINEINLDTTGAEINADKISLAGKEIKLTGDDITISSTNFNVSSDGTVQATNGEFSGEINASTGNISGWTIDSSGINNGVVFLHNDGTSTIYTVADLFIIRGYIQGTPGFEFTNQTMIKHYDLNNDGVVNSQDYVILKNLIGLDL